jgi:hypothetical protein
MEDEKLVKLLTEQARFVMREAADAQRFRYLPVSIVAAVVHQCQGDENKVRAVVANFGERCVNQIEQCLRTYHHSKQLACNACEGSGVEVLENEHAVIINGVCPHCSGTGKQN